MVGCKISRGDFFFLSRIFFFNFYGPQVDFFFHYYFYLPGEWQEVTKRFQPVMLGVGEVLPRKRLVQVV